MNFTEHHPQFFTATILEWKHLLKENKYKDIILDSLRFLVKEKRVVVNSFVIMSNHIHLIWQAINGFTPQQNQQSFLKYTAQQIKFDLQKNNQQLLEEFRVNAKDRTFQFWERNSLSIDLYSEEVYLQKENYIHYNPVAAGLCQYPEDYFFFAESPHFKGDVWQRRLAVIKVLKLHLFILFCQINILQSHIIYNRINALLTCAIIFCRTVQIIFGGCS